MRAPAVGGQGDDVLHELLKVWFELVRDWGYVGIFVLMALESSIFPVPSEIVVPPAAYWTVQGRFSFGGVILASTAGSLFGSLVTYAVARAVGRPLVLRYGKYLFLTPEKIALAEGILTRYALGGLFFSRLLPVVRHLCSIPAGLVQMNVWRFTAVTTIGAGLWCTILAWFGRQVIGDQPELLNDPDALVRALKAKLIWFVGGALVFLAAWLLVKWLGRRNQPAPAPVDPG